ncbi:TetR/AcrR family transcriptional regulator [Gordonia polyisoprenivorans]|uniref:TetR/AcrR family transcriptional regulator n=1 Tax=Gordonia polyisoprenivorans TaxID=84595 RepID=UPI001AD6B1F4|nr:TetR/AcrR family transcriptional regulator [Gordonia polyisoprenivorans]QTI69093.1 TetR family transcriptional regulator [Gordonia polyisoprenivorans]
MTTTTSRSESRSGVRGADKFEARRSELANATLVTLAELGYARTSLREIAQNSPYSHGVLHYYFRDKLDLIAEAVKIFEAMCVTRYDEAVATSTTAGELRHGFTDMFFTTLASESSLHRLWYDLRNQTRFESALRAEVADIETRRAQMIWNVIDRYCELRGEPSRMSESLAYVTFDGIFQRGLDDLLNGVDVKALESRRLLDEAFDAL